MAHRRIASGLALLLLLGPISAEENDDAPRESGMVERADTRLAQIDITVLGDPDVLAQLTASDFRIRINREKIEEFRLDRLCPDALPTETGRDTSVTARSAALPRPSYLLYFDQPLLTLEGRQRALDTATELVDRIVRDGARAMILSNAASLQVVQTMTDDTAVLQRALKALERDQTQWDTYAQLEGSRVEEVVRILNEGNDVGRAIAAARLHQKEERWRNEKSLRRLKLGLSRLGDVDPPRAVIYFADRLRSNAGEHYMSFFGQALRNSSPVLAAMATDSFAGSLPFDAVINEASAQGIRIYTVESRGLDSGFDSALPGTTALGQVRTVPSSSRERMSAVHSTLQSLSAESGGYAFLNGPRTGIIAERIRTDSSCLFLASFDPGDLREDAPLRVVVELRRDDAQVRVRGRLVLQSESTRLTAKLLRAFADEGSIEDPFTVRTALIPTGFESGNYSALLQVMVPPTPLQDATWDLGASMIEEERVRHEASGRLGVSRPGVPVVLESEVRFRPGDYEIVGVAHEKSSGLVSSVRLEATWNSPDRGGGTPGGIALLQPASGAFLRDGESRRTGPIALTGTDAVRPDRPTALVGLVCRGRKPGGSWKTERTLIGGSEVDFPRVDLDLSRDRCVQVRDVIPPGTLEGGFYRYEIRVLHEGQEVGSAFRDFGVLGNPELPPAS